MRLKFPMGKITSRNSPARTGCQHRNFMRRRQASRGPLRFFYLYRTFLPNSIHFIDLHVLQPNKVSVPHYKNILLMPKTHFSFSSHAIWPLMHFSSKKSAMQFSSSSSLTSPSVYFCREVPTNSHQARRDGQFWVHSLS